MSENFNKSLFVKYKKDCPVYGVIDEINIITMPALKKISIAFAEIIENETSSNFIDRIKGEMSFVSLKALRSKANPKCIFFS